MPHPQTPDDAVRQRATTPPWPVVLVALVVGLFLVPATTFGGYLLVTGQERQTAAAPLSPATSDPAPPPTTVPRNSDDWRTLLRGQTCEAPCIGGLACLSKPAACTSGLTCIPGAPGDRFADDEVWALHLSAVLEALPGGSAIDPCRSGKEFFVCRSGTTTCASQTDACAHAGKSSASIPVSGAELAHQGLSLEVRTGSAVGPLLAKTETIVDLRRGGLCRGFSAKAVGGDVRRVTYFVLPP